MESMNVLSVYRTLNVLANRSVATLRFTGLSGIETDELQNPGETRSRRMVVVLPAPLGPRNPKTTPAGTSIVRSFSARTEANCRVSALARMAICS